MVKVVVQTSSQRGLNLTRLQYSNCVLSSEIVF